MYIICTIQSANENTMCTLLLIRGKAEGIRPLALHQLEKQLSKSPLTGISEVCSHYLNFQKHVLFEGFQISPGSPIGDGLLHRTWYRQKVCSLWSELFFFIWKKEMAAPIFFHSRFILMFIQCVIKPICILLQLPHRFYVDLPFKMIWKLTLGGYHDCIYYIA